MAKGYWIAHVTVTNQESYQEYVKTNAAPIAKFGGKFLARGGKYETKKGLERERHVIVEFPSFEDAKACYEDPDYQIARKHQEAGADVDTVIVEGLDD